MAALLCLGSNCLVRTTTTPAISVPEQDTLILRDSDPSTLDPAMARETGSVGYIVQIFSGLVAFDKDMNLVPDIAESWETDNTNTVYTFHIREGVTFHDGRAVTAADFKYSWERACDPATGSETAGTYLNDIVGAAEMLAGNAQEMSGVQAVDDHTLRVTIDRPRAYFLSKLAQPVAFVVDREDVDSGQGWWRAPNGTGPFRAEGLGGRPVAAAGAERTVLPGESEGELRCLPAVRGLLHADVRVGPDRCHRASPYMTWNG